MYVGVTSRSVAWRWTTHCSMAKTSPKYKFHRAIAKYGPTDFEVVELHAYVTRTEAEQAEVALIAALDLVATGYNTDPGGGGGASNKGRIVSAETRAKISVAKKGVKTGTRGPASPEHRLSMIRAAKARKRPGGLTKGIKFSEEAKQKMARGQIARRAAEKHVRLNAEYGVSL
jgi:group I intron endonuclease